MRTATAENARLLSLPAAASYVGLGRNKTRAWMEEIGAVRRFGSRILFDKRVIDQALDNMAESDNPKVANS